MKPKDAPLEKEETLEIPPGTVNPDWITAI